MKNPLDHYQPQQNPYKEEWLSEEDRELNQSYNFKIAQRYNIDWENLYKTWKETGWSFRRLAKHTRTKVSFQWVADKLMTMDDQKKMSR